MDGDEEAEEWLAVCWGRRLREEAKIGRGGDMQEAKGKFRKNKEGERERKREGGRESGRDASDTYIEREKLIEGEYSFLNANPSDI